MQVVEVLQHQRHDHLEFLELADPGIQSLGDILEHVGDVGAVGE